MERLMTRKQAAEYLGFAPQTLARYAWLGKGPKFKKIGRLVRYTPESLEAWLKSEGVETSPATKQEQSSGDAKEAYVESGIIVDGAKYYPADKVYAALARAGAHVPFASFRMMTIKNNRIVSDWIPDDDEE